MGQWNSQSSEPGTGWQDTGSLQVKTQILIHLFCEASRKLSINFTISFLDPLHAWSNSLSLIVQNHL